MLCAGPTVPSAARRRACLYAHTHDFVRSVSTRQQPISHVFEQHRTLIPCHLTNIALRLGRKLQWDPESESFIGDDQANAHLAPSSESHTPLGSDRSAIGHMTSRRETMELTCLALTACLLTGLCSLASGADPRPNIVLIVADDLGFSDVGCYGGEIRTPNLDQLAAGGLRYTQFYNAAKCHTTRASLMAGLYPHQTGCELPLEARATRDSSRRVRHSGVSIAAVLQDAGYATYACGKWHAGGRPTSRGFDHFFGLPGGACSYFTPAKVLQRDDARATFSADQEFYFTDAITDEAVENLTQHFASDSKRPFFLYVAYTAPHWPMQAHEEDIARYRGRYSDGWQAIRKQRLQRLVDMGIISPKCELPEMEPPNDWHDNEYHTWEQRRMEVYAAMVDRMDQGIGRIVETVDHRGVLENTVVFFLSDNGGSQEEVQADTGFMVNVMPERRGTETQSMAETIRRSCLVLRRRFKPSDTSGAT